MGEGGGAVEGLVAEGFVPDRDVYLAFGHNEEVSGTGAAAIARQFVDGTDQVIRRVNELILNPAA